MAGSVDVAKLVEGVTSTGVQAVLEAIITIVKTGEDVNIKGVGTFSKKLVEARIGRNPATGETINIPAKNKIHFKPSKMISFDPPAKTTNRRRG